MNTLLSLINQERAKVGAVALSYRPDLLSASNIRAREASLLWSHTRPDGTPWYTVNNSIYGENLAKGYKTAEELIKAWMNSPIHKKVMLDGKYKGACIGEYFDGKCKWYSLELTL